MSLKDVKDLLNYSDCSSVCPRSSLLTVVNRLKCPFFSPGSSFGILPYCTLKAFPFTAGF